MTRAQAIAIPMKKGWRYWAGAALAALLGVGCQSDSPEIKRINNPAPANVINVDLPESPADSIGLPRTGNLEVVALFEQGPMPTGAAVSDLGRIFVNFPRWGDPVEFTVGEIVNGKVQPYPNQEVNKLQPEYAGTTFVSVQSVVVDPTGKRLWLLDTGAINFGTVEKRGAKLIGIDLATNKIVKMFVFPDDVALPTSYLNDVRFDLSRGLEGTAYITDSSGFGDNGIIVVDIATGKSMRRLHKHPSTVATPRFTPTVEGQPLKARVPGQPEAWMKMGSDGIAISGDGKTLYYCPLASRSWYSVDTDLLSDPKATDAAIAASVKEMPAREFPSDGLESDRQGRVYLTDYEHNAIRRWTPGSSTFEVLAASPRLIWPDSLALASDGFLYVTANQLNRQPNYHNGVDKRVHPYVLFRLKADAQPTRVK